MTNIILGYLLAVNIATFLLYGIDKYKAKKNDCFFGLSAYK